MKKLIGLFLTGALVLCLNTSAFAVATALATGSTKCQDDVCRQVTYIYAPTNVGVASTVVFKIAVPSVAGTIVSWHFKSASQDCDVFINPIDAGVLADAFVGYEAFNLGGRPEVPGGAAPYWNGDTPAAAYLYVTVKNDDGANATGTGVLTITFQK